MPTATPNNASDALAAADDDDLADEGLDEKSGGGRLLGTASRSGALARASAGGATPNTRVDALPRHEADAQQEPLVTRAFDELHASWR